MSTVVINSNLTIKNDNHIILETIEWINSFKQQEEINQQLIHLKEAIRILAENGIEVGLCVKYNSHEL